jgi:hypothetical protein
MVFLEDNNISLTTLRLFMLLQVEYALDSTLRIISQEIFHLTADFPFFARARSY